MRDKNRSVVARVVLFSKDEALAKTCREVLADIYGTQWSLISGVPGQDVSDDDLCIWDFIPGETHLPEDLNTVKSRRHFFLLSRNSLASFRQSVGKFDVNMLLKPVTRATLQAFVRGTVPNGHWKGGGSQALGSVRAERDDMLQFLIQANLRLQEYDQDRTNFLARSIHDFEAPLTAIAGYCGLLLEGELGPLTPEQREILERMQRSGSRLSRIAKAMFQLSTDQNVDHTLKLEEGDLRDCVEQALHEVAGFLDRKPLSITVDIAQSPVTLYFERAKVEEALVNLLDNACKFTPRYGSIEIKGYPFFWERRVSQAPALDPASDRRSRQTCSPNSFRLDICDSGPGIPPAHVDKIFEEYTSYSGGHDRSGAGLGLAICRMILQQHQGRIWAESSSEGARFSFVIPYTKWPRGAVAPEQDGFGGEQ